MVQSSTPSPRAARPAGAEPTWFRGGDGRADGHDEEEEEAPLLPQSHPPPLHGRADSAHGSIARLYTTSTANARRRAVLQRRVRGSSLRRCDLRRRARACCRAVTRRIPGCGSALEADTVSAGLLFLAHSAICAAIAAKAFLGDPSVGAVRSSMSDGLNDQITGGAGTGAEASLLEHAAACGHATLIPLVVLFALPILPLSVGAIGTLSLGGALAVIASRAALGLLDYDSCLPGEIASSVLTLFAPLLFAVFDACGQEARGRRALLQRLASRRAKTQADGVLEQLLPTHVNDKLRRNEPVPFEIHPNDVVMLWADLVGFTALSATLEPHQVMAILNALYSRFDALVERAHLWKVDTIGDAYVIIGGLVDAGKGGAADGNDLPGPALVERMFKVATSMREQVRSVAMATDQDIGIRIGIHSGPVATGIIGTLRPRWHVFGPTVLEAEHMESEGRRSWIQVSEAAFRLYNMRGFSLVERVRHPEPVVRPDPPLRFDGLPLPDLPPPRVAVPPMASATLPGPLPPWLDEQEAAEAAVEAREAEAAAANGGRHWVRPPREDGDGAIWSFWLHPIDAAPSSAAGAAAAAASVRLALPPGAAAAAEGTYTAGPFADLLALPSYLAAQAAPIDPTSHIATGTVPLSALPAKAGAAPVEARAPVVEPAGAAAAVATATVVAAAAGAEAVPVVGSSAAAPAAPPLVPPSQALAASGAAPRPQPAPVTAEALERRRRLSTRADEEEEHKRRRRLSRQLSKRRVAAGLAAEDEEEDGDVDGAGRRRRRRSRWELDQDELVDEEEAAAIRRMRRGSRRGAGDGLEAKPSRARLFLQQGALANVAPGPILAAAHSRAVGADPHEQSPHAQAVRGLDATPALPGAMSPTAEPRGGDGGLAAAVAPAAAATAGAAEPPAPAVPNDKDAVDTEKVAQW